MSLTTTNTFAVGTFNTAANISDCDNERSNNGRWTKEEHQRFVDAIKVHGKNWKKVEECVGSRSGAQIRSHAQKFFLKLEKELKTNQKGKSNKKNSEASTMIDTISASAKPVDSLKKNLPFTEIYENLTETSENAAGQPENHLIAAEKSTSDASSVATKSNNDMQAESANYAKSSKAQLLSKLKACEEKVDEYHQLVKNYTTTDTTSTYDRTPTLGNSYHHFVYLDLMNYFYNFNKTAQSLKISDFVDLSSKTSTKDEDSYEPDVNKKRVKML